MDGEEEKSTQKLACLLAPCLLSLLFTEWKTITHSSSFNGGKSQAIDNHPDSVSFQTNLQTSPLKVRRSSLKLGFFLKIVTRRLSSIDSKIRKRARDMELNPPSVPLERRRLD